MNIRTLALAIRIALLVVLLIAIAWLLFSFRVSIGNALIPWFKTIVLLVEHRYAIADFAIIREKTEFVYYLRLHTDNAHRLYGHTLPGMDVSATTLVTHSLQQIFLLVAIVLAGLLFYICYWWRLLLLTPVLLLVAVAIDIPFVLLGSIEGLLLQHFAPDRLDSNWLVKWEQFISGGGRPAVGIGFGILALSIARKPVS